MLRTSLRSVRVLGGRPAATAASRQWLAAVARPAQIAGQRYYADEKKPAADAAKPAALPASETLTSPATKAPSTDPVKAPTISAENVPRTPPSPSSATTTSAPPPPPPPPSQPSPPPRRRGGFFRRLRNYLLTLTVLGVLAFGGGVWYSRVNDNFHDFFTEYVPYGEQAVLYLEEMDFRRRFPNATGQQRRVAGAGADVTPVKIPAQSGASWRVADGANESGASRQSSALPPRKADPSKKKEEQKNEKKQNPVVSEAKKETAELPVTDVKRDVVPDKAAELSTSKPDGNSGSSSSLVIASANPTSKSDTATTPEPKPFKAPEVDEPSRWPPASPIDPLAVNDATEPVVQELVRMLNDIVTVVNADGANVKYGATIGKAKDKLNQVGQQIRAIKEAAEKEAAQQVHERVDDFDKAANELVSRVEAAMATQETQWRDEFTAEMERMRAAYDERLRLAVDRERQLNDERTANRLLEQAVALQRQFTREVKAQVEAERDGRLGRLRDLADRVADLAALTDGWNELVDAGVRTQQLHVALDAVRASLAADEAQQLVRRPFVRELAALKEAAAGDPVVDAAVATIAPAAYQRGVATPAELVDRFRRVAAEVRKASLLPEGAGVASHASSWVLSKMLFQKQGTGMASSSSLASDAADVESILARTQLYLEEGDLDSSAREMNALSGWAKVLSQDWLAEVRKVLEVRQALEVIQAEARLQSLRVEEQ